ncbi:hotdog fold thioesterase [Desulfococcus sp.]|uniref:hotdog fold thioesterase n=1 Tax=Desulfococcus sp. TaxID=2025834 RepID=UPI003594764E
MSIWFTPPDLEEMNRRSRDTLVQHIGIEYIAAGDDFLTATMPVDERTIQPHGILHGGASVVLAETLGSAAAMHCIDPARQYCVGLDINANHIRSVSRGTVSGTASPAHLGRSTQVWEIRIADERGRLVCLSRITLAILQRESTAGDASGSSPSHPCPENIGG